MIYFYDEDHLLIKVKGLPRQKNGFEFAICEHTEDPDYLSPDDGWQSTAVWFEPINLESNNGDMEFQLKIDFNFHVDRGEIVKLKLRSKGKRELIKEELLRWMPEDIKKKDAQERPRTEALVAFSTSKTVRKGKSVSIDLKALNRKNANEDVSFAIKNGPELTGKVSINGGHFEYVSGKDQTGSEVVKYSMRSGSRESSGEITINTIANYVPWLVGLTALGLLAGILAWVFWPAAIQAEDDVFEIVAGTPVQQDVLLNDKYPSYKVELEIVTPPGAVEYEILDNKQILLTVAEDSQIQQDSFVYRITENGESSEALAQLQITPLPLFTLDDDNLEVGPYEEANVNVLSNDIVPGTPDSVKIISQPSLGRAKLDAMGKLTYSSPDNFGDQDVFLEYEVTVGDRKRTARVNFQQPQPDPIIAEADSATVVAGEKISFNVVDNDTLPLGQYTVDLPVRPVTGSARVNRDGVVTFRADKDISETRVVVFPYEITVGSQTESAEIEISILFPIALNDDYVDLIPGQKKNIKVLENDSVPENSEFAVEVLQESEHLFATVSADNSIDIELSDDAPTGAQLEITYQVTYGDQVKTAKVLVKTPRILISAQDDEIIINPGKNATLNLLDNDNVPLNGFTVEVIQAPLYGAAELSADGVLSLRYSDNVRVGISDNLRYRITFEQQTAKASVEISIEEESIPVNAMDDVLLVSGKEPTQSTNVLENDEFASNRVASLEIVTQPQYGSAKVVRQRFIEYTYTGPLDTQNSDTLTYRLQVGGDSGSAKLNINFEPVQEGAVCEDITEFGSTYFVQARQFGSSSNVRISKAIEDFDMAIPFATTSDFCVMEREVTGDQFRAFVSSLSQQEKENVKTNYQFAGSNTLARIDHKTTRAFVDWVDRKYSQYKVMLPNREEWLAAFIKAFEDGRGDAFQSFSRGTKEWSRANCGNAKLFYVLGDSASDYSNSNLSTGFQLCEHEMSSNNETGIRLIFLPQ